MRCCLPPCRALPTLLAVLLLALSTAPLAAQARNFRTGQSMGIGYTAAFPDVQGSVGVWHIFGGTPFGIFADAKMTIGTLRDEPTHCPAAITPCTIATVEAQQNDLFIRDEDEYRIVNAGAMYAITPEFVLMLGAGAVQKRSIREYFDEEEEPITETGQYFVDHTADPTTEIQGVAGMLIRAGNRLAFRFGYETAPGGMSLGAYFMP
jgi:hypothetical protein